MKRFALGGVGLAVCLMHLAQPACAANAPVIGSLAPQSAVAGGQAFTLNVYGSSFNGNSVVFWNGSPRATGHVSSTQLMASISSTDIATAGTATVTVVNTKPASLQSNPEAFIVAPAAGLQILTTSLPGGTVGSAYGTSLAAAGGTPPYTWSIFSGALPPGLALGGSGTISGTPTASGAYSFTVQVRDSSPTAQTATQALNINIAGGGNLQITTNSLASGVVQQPYTADLKATGGTAPYTWTLSSGLLPLGLTLSSSAGTVSGTATQSGQSSLTFQVADSSLPLPQAATKTYTLSIQPLLDAYGGSPQLACPSGPAPHFYTQKIGNRWWLCTPAGNVFWMRGVYVVDADDTIDYAGVSYTNQVTSKYGDSNLTWGPQANRRLKSWGFNSLAEYSSLYVLPTTTNSTWPNSQQPVLMPFTGLAWPSYYALYNQGNYANGPVKELVRATKLTVFTGYRGHSPDVWDPNFKMWLDGFLQHDYAAPQWISGPNNSYFIGFNVDDTDFLEGFGAGADFKTVANGVASGGREQPHPAWLILITPPTQTSNSEFNVTYTDTTVYSKQALMNFLVQRYTTIGALNLAWGSAYTTFGDSGGWGTGTGLLDEDGTHSWVPKDYTYLSDANANIKKDLDDFLFQHAQQYFSVIRSELNLRAPGFLYLGPTTLSSWGSPPRRQVLQAAASYLDVFMAATIPSGVPDDQQRIDFIEQYLGDKPWLEWEGFDANPDSYMYPFAPGDTVQAQSSTQAQRGQIYTNMVSLLINARATTGAFPVVGFKWWQFVDNRGEGMNWGLVTRRDNEYDNLAAAVASGTDSWAFPTGGETYNYGNFINAVQSSNLQIMQTLLSTSW